MTARAESDARVRAQALLDLGDHYRTKSEYTDAVDHRLARYQDARARWTEAIAEFETVGRPTDRLRRNLTTLPDRPSTSNA